MRDIFLNSAKTRAATSQINAIITTLKGHALSLFFFIGIHRIRQIELYDAKLK